MHVSRRLQSWSYEHPLWESCSYGWHMDFEHGVRLCALQEEDTTRDSYGSQLVMHEKKKKEKKTTTVAWDMLTAGQQRGIRELMVEEQTYRVEWGNKASLSFPTQQPQPLDPLLRVNQTASLWLFFIQGWWQRSRLDQAFLFIRLFFKVYLNIL